MLINLVGWVKESVSTPCTSSGVRTVCISKRGIWLSL